MKRLQCEFEELQSYKKLGTEAAGADSGHGEQPLPPMGSALEKVHAENARLKYQLSILQRVRMRDLAPM